MKYIIGGFLVLVVVLLVFSSDGQAPDTTQSEQSTLTYASIQEEVASGDAAFLDVRTPEEFYESHYEGAELMPLQELEQGKLPQYSTDTTLYVYCRSGNRSQDATRILEASGFNVVDLGGLPDVANVGGILAEDPCPLGDISLCLQQDANEGA